MEIARRASPVERFGLRAVGGGAVVDRSNGGDVPAVVRKVAAERELRLPIAIDTGGKLATRFDVRTTAAVRAAAQRACDARAIHR